jgi:predicted TIM-barrel fold metal-dependent hydrolase
MGCACSYLRAGRQIPLCAGPGLHPAGRASRSLYRALDHLGFARGLLVQGNAHGYDNRGLLDALARFPQRVRGVAITDTRIAPATLRDWHRLGMRGLRFHLFSEAGKPGYVRGVGLDVFEVFRSTMRELGWVMQVFCDWRLMSEVAATLREISREMPVIVDHMLNIPAGRGVKDANFQALLRLVGEGNVHVKLSAAYRLSDEFPDYPDARPFHDALLRANPGRLIWGTDWPHPSIHASVMPDDGHLLDVFHRWTPDESARRLILVETPARLFGN